MKGKLKYYVTIFFALCFIGVIIFMMNQENGLSLKIGLIYIGMVSLPIIVSGYKLKK